MVEVVSVEVGVVGVEVGVVISSKATPKHKKRMEAQAGNFSF
jgi:hypothetical protein